MKLNKIISTIAAIAMLSTSLVSVSAETAIELVDDGVKVVGTMPSLAEVEARKPVLTFENVTELADYDAVKAAAGTAFANKTKKDTLAQKYDVYQVTLKFSDIGALVNGYDDSWEYASYIGVKTINFSVNPGETGFMGHVKTTAQLADGTFKCAQDTETGYYNFIWSASDAGNPYPSYDTAAEGDASYVKDQPIEFVTFFAFPEGKVVTLKPENYFDVFVNYMCNCKGEIGLANCVAEVPASYTFGEEDEPKEMEVTVADKRFDLDINDDTVADGYAWEVLITNYDSTKTLSAKFTDAETGLPRAGKEKTEITGLAAAAETDGSIEFVALLQLSQARNVNFEIVVE